jgi:hypothetical protein
VIFNYTTFTSSRIKERQFYFWDTHHLPISLVTPERQRLLNLNNCYCINKSIMQEYFNSKLSLQRGYPWYW